MAMLRQITRKVTDIEHLVKDVDSRVKIVENAGAGSDSGNSEQNFEEDGEHLGEVEQDLLPEDITPTTLRQRAPLMKKAADRLTRVRWQDDDSETTAETTRNKSGGKKSGSILVAAETVEERIDWPHMYVTRMAAGKRKGVSYSDLTSEEFVLGYVHMLQAPHCNWDTKEMLTLLGVVMQHSVEYSWENARAFFQDIGIGVEKDRMGWSDEAKIMNLRFTHSRNRGPERRENSESAKPPLKIAAPGTKACAAYQSHTCEQQRDHAPFTHSCSYCLRVCNALCRHAEADCIRRVADAAKNGQKREQ